MSESSSKLVVLVSQDVFAVVRSRSAQCMHLCPMRNVHQRIAHLQLREKFFLEDFSLLRAYLRREERTSQLAFSDYMVGVRCNASEGRDKASREDGKP